MSDEKLGLLRIVALIAVAAGAVGSIGLLFHASQHAPRLLIALFVMWVLGPFLALGLAHVAAKRWGILSRGTLSALMLVVTLGSLAAYVDDAFGHRRPQAAFVYVVVPLASWIVMMIAVGIGVLKSRKLLRPDARA